MIPEFPQFKTLELSDRWDVETLAACFPPYSDFNFVSLWCWNTDGRCAISRLNGNLVIRLNDYITCEPFLSFIGTNAIGESAEELLDHAERMNIEPRLRLVPEEVVSSLVNLGDSFLIEQEPGDADYVLSIQEWADLGGGKFKDERKAVNRFERERAPTFFHLDLKQSETQSEINRMFGLWIRQRDRSALDETFNEAVAVLRFFSLEQSENLHGFGVEAGGELRAFALVESLDSGYVMGHFWKGDTNCPGVYPYLLHQMSVHFEPLALRFFNIEQDLGKEGLRRSKMSFRPYQFLKKYEISRRPLETAGAPASRDGRSIGIGVESTP